MNKLVIGIIVVILLVLAVVAYIHFTQAPVFYTGLNYTGAAYKLGAGEYPNMLAAGLPNDALQSAKVPAGWEITIYQDTDFANQILSMNTQKAAGAYPTFDNYNKMASSLKITKL